MPIPKELHAGVLPQYNKQEEHDYECLSQNVLHGLRRADFPFELELRTKRHNGWYVADVDFTPSSIERVKKDLEEAQYIVHIREVKEDLYNHSIKYQVMRVLRPHTIVSDSPPPYSLS
jgi:hypothetical protein